MHGSMNIKCPEGVIKVAFYQISPKYNCLETGQKKEE
jgi:hypothetical protein